MITAFTGLPGSGKTLSMTLSAYDYWKETNCPIFANYNIRFPKNVPIRHSYRLDWSSLKKGRLDLLWETTEQEWYYPNVLYGDDFLDAFKQVDRACFLIDEAGTIFDNRSWQKFPKWLMAKFRESRKCQLEIMYTAQDIADVDVKLRQLTNFLCFCKFSKLRLKLGGFQKDLFLKNEYFHNQVIRNDTPANRKIFSAGSEFFFPKQFKPAYNYYRTGERIIYEIPEGREIENLLQKNLFQTGEWK